MKRKENIYYLCNDSVEKKEAEERDKHSWIMEAQHGVTDNVVDSW